MFNESVSKIHKEVYIIVNHMQLVFVGLSNFNSRQVDEVIKKAKVKPAVNQVECHPYLNQEQLIEHCKKSNVLGEFCGSQIWTFFKLALAYVR